MAVASPHHASSEEEAMILDVVRELVAEKVAPRAADIDERGEYPQDIRKLFAENDLLGIPIPAEYGGLGGTFLTYVKVVEEIAKACASSSLIVAVQELDGPPLHRRPKPPRCLSTGSFTNARASASSARLP